MRHFGHHDPLPPDAKGAAFALGKFDGVHLGHLAVLASAREAGARLGAPLAAPVFSPHPQRRLRPDAAPFLLQTARQRERALAAAGVALLFEFDFDDAFLSLTAHEFADQILARRLSVRHVSVGPNVRYGRGRAGDLATLMHDGAELGFAVSTAPPVMNSDGEPISSSAIRTALVSGNLIAANAMLGRPWAIEGIVARGFARGREFGFPTLNIALGEYLAPKLGVYAVQADIGDGEIRPGVASIGVNPSVGALPAPLLEVHLLDFERDLYGRTVETHLIAFLRPEQKFENIEALKAQMARDADQARAILA